MDDPQEKPTPVSSNPNDIRNLMYKPGYEFVANYIPYNPDQPFIASDDGPAGTVAEQMANIQQRMDRQIAAYTPRQDSYWENPQTIARYHQTINSAPPGWQPPDWLDVNAINQAYDYYQSANNGEPWQNWKALPQDDPYRQVLQSFPTPPADFLMPGEGRFTQGDLSWQVPANVNALGYDKELWKKLPLDQKVYLSTIGTPAGNALLSGLGFMGLGSLAGGLTAAGVGAVTGTAIAPGVGTIIGGAAGLIGGIALGIAANEENEKMIADPTYQSELLNNLSVLDVPFQWMEKNIGLLEQIEAAMLDSEKYGTLQEVFANYEAAREASRLMFESFAADAGTGIIKQWELGVPEPVGTTVLPEGMESSAWAMVTARRRIMDGEAPEAVYQDMAQKFGWHRDVRELIAGFIPGVDPLDTVGDVGGVGVSKLSSLSNNKALRIAASISGGRTIETYQNYGAILRTGMTGLSTLDISKMDFISRWAAGVTAEGKVLSLDNSKPGFLGWLFQLTPKSRALELLATSSTNLQFAMERAQTPLEVDQMVAGLARTDLEAAKEISSMSWVNAPEGAAFPLALRDFNKLPTMAAVYEATRWKADIIHKLSVAMDITPAEVVVRLLAGEASPELKKIKADIEAAMQNGASPGRAVADLEAVMKKAQQGTASADSVVAELRTALAEKGANDVLTQIEGMTGEQLQGIARTFVDDGVAYDFDQYKAQVYGALTEHIENWAVKWFGVKPDPTLLRLANTVKAVQSVALLGLNPTYLINNAINNYVTMAFSGVFGLRSAGQINRFWNAFGAVPPRLRAGIGGFAGIGDDASMGKTIRAKSSVENGILAGIDRAMHGEKLSKLLFATNWSQKIERNSSAVATTVGTQQAYNRLWVPGLGFDRLDPSTEAALRQINPRLPDMIYDAIRSGLNQKQIEEKIWGGMARKSLDSVIDAVAKDIPSEVPLSGADLRDILEQTGVYDVLAEKIKNAEDDEGVRRAVRDTLAVIQNRLDDKLKADNERIATETTASVLAEGVQAALDVFDRLWNDMQDFWLTSSDDWGDVFERTDAMNQQEKNAVFNAQHEANQSEWSRAKSVRDAKVLGIFRGLGASDPQIQMLERNLLHINDIWGTFHADKARLYRDFFNTAFDGKEERSAAWREVRSKVQEMYAERIAAEAEIQKEVDGLFVEMFEKQFNSGGQAAQAWRDGVANIRARMTNEIKKFNAVLDMLPFNERRAAQKEFYKTIYQPLVMELTEANLAKTRAMYGIDAPVTGAPQKIIERVSIRDMQEQLSVYGIERSGDWEGEYKQLNRYLDPGERKFTVQDYYITPTADFMGRLEKAMERREEARNIVRQQAPQAQKERRSPARMSNEEFAVKVMELVGAKTEEEALEALTNDKMTGLERRARFDLAREEIEALPEGHPDKKHFAAFDGAGITYVNNTFGHEVGDVVIAMLATIVKEEAELHGGKAYRMSDQGDEFGVIAPQGMAEEIARVASERAKNAILVIDDNGTERYVEGFGLHSGTGKNWLDADLAEKGAHERRRQELAERAAAAGADERTFGQSEIKEDNLLARRLEAGAEAFTGKGTGKSGAANITERLLEQIRQQARQRQQAGEVKLAGEQAAGLAEAMQGENLLAVTPDGSIYTPEDLQHSSATMTPQERKQAILNIAHEYGISTASKSGRPNDKTALNVINKYSGQKFASLEDIDIDTARAAFEARQQAKLPKEVDDAIQAVKAEQKFNILTPSQGAVDIPGGDVRQMIADGLAELWDAKDVDLTMRLMDARAETWAAGTGKNPLDWWHEFLGGVRREMDDEEALFRREQLSAQEQTRIRVDNLANQLREKMNLPEEADYYTIEDKFNGQKDHYYLHAKDIFVLGEEFANARKSLQAAREGKELDYGSRTFRNKLMLSEGPSKTDGGWFVAYKVDSPYSSEIKRKFNSRAEAERFAQNIKERGESLYSSTESAATSFLEDGRAVIHAIAESPNLADLLHEVGHVFRKQVGAEDMQIVIDWLKNSYGETVEYDPQTGRFVGDNEIALLETGYTLPAWEWAEEMFAGAFTKYLRDGMAPTTGLVKLFEKIKQFMRSLYSSIKGTDMDVNITPELRGVFDRLLAENPRPTLRMPERPIGKQIKVWSPDYQRSFDVVYKLVDMDDLTVSQMDNLKTNTSYPNEMQPRDRTRFATMDWLNVNSQPGRFNPVALLAEMAGITEGAPIIGDDGVVESGNKRMLLLRKIAQEQPALYQQYLDQLGGMLEQYGFSKDALKDIDRPVLVRQRMSDVDRVEFAKLANQSSLESMSAFENTRVDAELISDEALVNFQIGEGTLLDALDAKANKDFVSAFVGALPQNERSKILSATGKVTPEGKQRLANAMFAKVYGGASGEKLLIGLLENEVDTVKNLSNALYRSLGSMGKAEAAVQAGKIDPALSVVEDIANVVDYIGQLRKEGKSVDEFLAQPVLIDVVTPEQRKLMAFFNANRNAIKPVQAFIEAYADILLKQPDYKQQALFTMEPVSKMSVIDGAINQVYGSGVGAKAFEEAKAPEVAAPIEVGPAAPPTPEESTAALAIGDEIPLDDVVDVKTEDIQAVWDSLNPKIKKPAATQDSMFDVPEKAFELTQQFAEEEKFKPGVKQQDTLFDTREQLIPGISGAKQGGDESGLFAGVETPGIIDFSENDIPYELAYDAYRNISFVPEERAKQRQRDYFEHIQSVVDHFEPMADTPEKIEALKKHLERYKEGYIKRYREYLAAKGRTASTDITGPANFPARQMQVRNEIVNKRLNELLDWSEKAQRAIKRDIAPEQARSISADNPEAITLLQNKIDTAEQRQALMVEANKIARSKSIPKGEKIGKLVELGLQEKDARKLLEPDYTGRVGYAAFELQNNNANIKRMKDRVAEIQRNREISGGEMIFDGGRIVENTEENRIQIFFDAKPDEAMRASLKHQGFKWAPSQGAWQRQTTDNARAAVRNIFPDARKIEAEAPAIDDADIILPNISDEEPGEILYRRGKADPKQQPSFFSEGGEDLPLFSGTAMRANEQVFNPQPEARQLSMFGVPEATSGTKVARISLLGKGVSSKLNIPVDDFGAIEELIKIYPDAEVRYSITNAEGTRVYSTGSNLKDLLPKPGQEGQGTLFRRDPQSVTVQHITTEEEHGGMRIIANVYKDGKLVAYLPERYQVAQWQDGAESKFRFLGLDVHDPNYWVMEYEDGSIRQFPRDGAEKPVAVNAPIGTADQFNPTPPLAEAESEGWMKYVKPALSAIEKNMTGKDALYSRDLMGIKDRLDPQTERAMRMYLSKVYDQQRDVKLAAVRHGEMKRDEALLNYTKRTNLDNYLTAVFPYQFWYTRSMLNWAKRFIDRPSILAKYNRLMQVQRNQEKREGYPTRLRGKMAIPVPFLPDWAGGYAFVDPYKQIYPFRQFAKPLEMLESDRNLVEKQARGLIYDWIENGEVDEAQAQQALTDKTGALWRKAFTQAQKEAETDIKNPFDFASMIVSPSLPLTWAGQAITGHKDRIGQLPFTRMVQGLTGMAGVGPAGGLNLEKGARNALGLPEVDRFDDYRVDRMLSNLTADGVITPDEALRAMIEREGPVYEEAQRRSGQVRGWQWLGSALGADFYPGGEQRQRELYSVFGDAMDAYNNGDKQALSDFFDENPELEARLASFKDPDERLRKFMISEVWDRYMALPDLKREAVRDQLGGLFNDAFLDKETRSYNAINTQTLATWAQALGTTPVKGAEGAQMYLNMPGEAETNLVQQYNDMREQMFPNIYETQSVYYSLPEGRARDLYGKQHPEIEQYSQWRNLFFAQNPAAIPLLQSEKSDLYGLPVELQHGVYVYRATRDQQFPGVFDLQEQYFNLADKARKKEFLQSNPILPDYWDWRKQFAAQNPRIAVYILGDEKVSEALGGEKYSSDYAVVRAKGEFAGFNFSINQLSPTLIEQVQAYLYAGQPLSAGAQMALEDAWVDAGKPGGDFDTFVEGFVLPAVIRISR